MIITKLHVHYPIMVIQIRCIKFHPLVKVMAEDRLKDGQTVLCAVLRDVHMYKFCVSFTYKVPLCVSDPIHFPGKMTQNREHSCVN